MKTANKGQAAPCARRGLLLLLACGALPTALQAFPDFDPAAQALPVIAPPALSGHDLRSQAQTVFAGQYEQALWNGDLLAISLDNAGRASPQARFSAARQLDARTAPRLIFTMKSDGSGIPFAFAQLGMDQQRALDRSKARLGVAAGPQVLDYLRGNRSLEATGEPGGLRTRGSRLGAIIQSRPLVVHDTHLASGQPKTQSPPLPTVFVGSNDGMLHAFDAGATEAGAGRER